MEWKVLTVSSDDCVVGGSHISAVTGLSYILVKRDAIYGLSAGWLSCDCYEDCD